MNASAFNPFSLPRLALLPNLALAGMLLVVIFGNQPTFLAWNEAMQVLPDAWWANLTLLGDALVALALVLPFLRGRPQLAGALLAASLLATLVVQGIKPFLDLPRPLMVLSPGSFYLTGVALKSHAFPSGHTATIFALAALASTFVQRPRTLLLLVLAASLVGLSRVAVGAHWPLDVLAGAVAGWLSGLAGVWLASRYAFLRGEKLSWVVQAIIVAGTVWLLIGYHSGYAEADRLQRVLAFLALWLFFHPCGCLGLLLPRKYPWYSLFGLAGVVFLAVPELDLWASARFYRLEQGFFLQPLLNPIHQIVPWLGRALFLGLLGAFLLANLISAPWPKRKALLFLLLALIVGPGLLVNAVFKDHWHRARPAQIEEFGGDSRFTPAWVKTDQCERNCSFACGDASVGFALLAPAFLFASRRRQWLAVGLTAGGLLGLMRLAQGGHFLSDVVFSLFIVYFVIWLLHRLLYRDSPSAAS